MDNVLLYAKVALIALKSQAQFRTDFGVGLISVVAMNVLNLGLIGIVVARFSSINGWTVWEMVFLYCFWMTGHSAYSVFFWHIQTLDDYIVRGTFDQFLLRPASVFALFAGREIHYMGVADFIFGVSGLGLAYLKLRLDWAVERWMWMGVLIVSGTIIETAVNVGIASMAFWNGRARRASDAVFQLSVMVQQYPLDVYGKFFRLVVTGIVPVAFLNYYPVLWLLDKSTVLGEWFFLSYLSPVVAVLSVLIARFLWKTGIRRYASSGG